MIRDDIADEAGDTLLRTLREDGERPRFCPSCNLLVQACRHTKEKE